MKDVDEEVHGMSDVRCPSIDDDEVIQKVIGEHNGRKHKYSNGGKNEVKYGSKIQKLAIIFQGFSGLFPNQPN